MKLQENKKTIIVITIGFLIGSVILRINFAPYLFLANSIVTISVLIILIQLAFPKLGVYISKTWIKFGHALGYINSRIILTIIYFVVLYPVSILFKISNKNPLKLKKTKNSNFIERNHLYTKEDLENLW